MKQLLAIGLGVLLALPILSATQVFAVDDTSTSSNTVQNDNQTTTTETKPETQNTMAERIAAQKAALKIKLTATEKVRLQSKCKAAQGQVSSISSRVKGLETSRNQVYKNLTKRLTELSAKLKNNGVDTTELNADIAVLQTKIDTFNTDMATYKQAVSDLGDMDCKADAEGFKAALETARSAREKVHQDGQAIGSYLKDTIKPLLTTIRSQIKSDKPEGQQ